MTATAGTSAIHAGYIGHFCKSGMIQVIPAITGLEYERTWILAVQEQLRTAPLCCICTSHSYGRKLLKRLKFWHASSSPSWGALVLPDERGEMLRAERQRS